MVEKTFSEFGHVFLLSFVWWSLSVLKNRPKILDSLIYHLSIFLRLNIKEFFLNGFFFNGVFKMKSIILVK